MARPKSNIKELILTTVEKRLRLSGVGSLTIDLIAKEAGCAKGLVNYHFGTKSDLLAAASDRLLNAREGKWNAALKAPTPELAIERSWALIREEVDQGVWKAWISLNSSGEEVIVRAVNNSLETFGATLSASVRELLEALGLVPSVPPEELGHLVTAAIHGFEVQLSAGATPQHVEGGHTAMWLAVLSLAGPKS
jgi:AcrR family transcriptional regulator